MIITDMAKDPYYQQIVFGVHAKPKCGKTTMIMDLALADQFVFVFSIDRGMSKLRHGDIWKKYAKRLFPVYIVPTEAEAIADARSGMTSLFTKYLMQELHWVVKGYPDLKGPGRRDPSIPYLLFKGVPAARIWIVIDTVTHMQRKLLRDGQEAEIDRGLQAIKPKRSRDGEAAVEVDQRQARALQYVTQPLEWNANLACMTMLTDYIFDNCPFNIVYTFLSVQDKDNKNVVCMKPDIQAASYSKLMGDCDVIYHLEQKPDGKRLLHCRPTIHWEAGDRFGVCPSNVEMARAEDGFLPTLLQARQAIFEQGKQEMTVDSSATSRLPNKNEHQD